MALTDGWWNSIPATSCWLNKIFSISFADCTPMNPSNANDCDTSFEMASKIVLFGRYTNFHVFTELAVPLGFTRLKFYGIKSMALLLFPCDQWAMRLLNATNEHRISRSTLTADHPRYRCEMVCKSSVAQCYRGYLAYMLAERMESPRKVRARIFRIWFALCDEFAAKSVSTSANVIYPNWWTLPFFHLEIGRCSYVNCFVFATTKLFRSCLISSSINEDFDSPGKLYRPTNKYWISHKLHGQRHRRDWTPTFNGKKIIINSEQQLKFDTNTISSCSATDLRWR